MKGRVLGSAGSLENLVSLFNERMFSTSWIAKESDGVLKFYNTKLKKFASGYIRNENGRFQWCEEE